MSDISVLVVDDHAIFAQAVQSLLSREPDLRPVWIANTAGEARTLLSRHRPTVVVLDLVLGDGSGLDLAEQAREQSPDTRVLMLTGVTSTEPVVAALQRGVRGWLPKTVDSDRLVRVIRGVAHGEAWLAPELLGTELPQLVGQPGAAPPDPLAGLTAREREVLQCLVDGLTRTEVAGRLYLSTNTVRTHTQNVLAKLGVHATLEAVALALRHGMVQRPAQAPPERAQPPSEVPPQRPQPIRPATGPPPPGGLTQIA